MTASCQTEIAPAQTAPGRRFELPDRRVLLPLVFVMVRFSLDEDRALWAVEDGSLLGFNLACQSEGRRKVHVWRAAIENYNSHETPRKKTAVVDSVIAASLPSYSASRAATATIRASELAFRWSLSRTSVTNLIDAGELCQVGDRSGNESARVSHASAAEFLKRRVV